VAKKLGNDYRIWIESTTPGTFNLIKGNQDLAINREGSTIDTTTKEDFPWGTAAPGTRSLSVTASFIPDLPDANGYTRLMDLAGAGTSTPIPIQIRKGGSTGADPADTVFECNMYATTTSTPMGMNAPVTANVTFVAAEPPTIDELA
jgi:hypothetical protein